MLTRRFGALSPQLDERLQQLSISQLEELGVAIFDFSTIEDVVAWIEACEL